MCCTKEEVYELKLYTPRFKDGKTVFWTGTSPENAAQRYVDSHPSSIVIAWRRPKTELKIGMVRIEE